MATKNLRAAPPALLRLWRDIRGSTTPLEAIVRFDTSSSMIVRFFTKVSPDVAEEGVREPATYHGLHAIRPTIGSASMDRVQINSPSVQPLMKRLVLKNQRLMFQIYRIYDTVGLFGRSLDDLASIVKHSLDLNIDEGMALPRRIIYPNDFFPLPDPAHQKLIDSFVEQLETHLGVQRTEVSLAQLWEDMPPSDSHAASQSLQDYMKKVNHFPSTSSYMPITLTIPEAPFWSLYYDHYQVSDQFRSGYLEKFNREPFVEASSRFRWYDFLIPG